MWPFPRRSERKENPVGGVISAWTVGQPVWSERRFDKLADEAYVRNAVGFKCTKLIASSAAMAPWMLSSKKKALETHPLLDLLSRPSAMVGGHALFEAIYAYLLLSGNTYLVAPEMAGGTRPPKELWTLRPDRMKPIAGPFGAAQAYEYEANGQRRIFKVDPLTGAGEVLHVREFHPLNDWYGLSRVEAAAYGVDRHNAASAHNKALLDNGARPSGALVFMPVKGQNGAEQAAPPDVINQAKKDLDESHVGPTNAGKPFVFGGNVDWLEMGASPKDMDFNAGKDDAARDICNAFGVPHILIVPGAATYNNVREAKAQLWQETILPILDHMEDALNAWLTPRFGDGLTLGVDLDAVSALEPVREAKRTSILNLYKEGLLDGDEARGELGYGARTPGAIKLQRGDGQTIAALVAAAVQDTGMLEPLYRYLMSVGLLDAATTLEQFEEHWSGAAPKPTVDDMLAAIGKAPSGRPAPPQDGGQ